MSVYVLNTNRRYNRNFSGGDD